MNHLQSPFAHPHAFWLLPVLGLALLAVMWGWKQRRRAVTLLGKMGAVRKLLLVSHGSRLWSTLCLLTGMGLLLVASAGPRWGREFSRDTVKGHDIVVVLDVSRSMLAEQPSRQERALRALRNLVKHLEKHGGQRLALVVFAARPYLVFPLTRDYDHFRQALTNIEAGNLPPDVRPPANNPPPSGTRLGAGLRLALQTLDPKNVGPNALLLLSDGDDPAGDKEWEDGVQAANALRVPIHTIGIGDPTQENPILIQGEFLEYDGKIVQTKLEEAVLQEIAERTGGRYVPARTNDLPLGSWLPELLRKQPDSRPPTDSLSAVPVLRPRHGFFLWPALLLLCASVVWGERGHAAEEATKQGRRENKNGKLKIDNRPVSQLAICICLFIVFLVAAAFADDDWIRQGNAAFNQDKLTEALALYEKAEEGTHDPGLVAFNKAVVLSRLDRQREAELHFRRCLEDDRAPALRKAQALFGLGNALLRQAGEKDIAGLDEAVDAFSSCLAIPDLSGEFKSNVEYNLELARWLRFQAVAAATKPPPQDPPRSNTPPDPTPPKPMTNADNSRAKEAHNDSSQGDEGQDTVDPTANPNMTGKGSVPGRLTNIPDDPTKKIPLEDTAKILDQEIQRITQEQSIAIRNFQPASPRSTKDW